jgi:hypothetical protein
LAALLREDGISPSKLLLAALFFEDRIRRPNLARFVSAPRGRTFCPDLLMLAGLPDFNEQHRAESAAWEERYREDYLCRRAAYSANVETIDGKDVPRLLEENPALLESPSLRAAICQLSTSDSVAARETLKRIATTLRAHSKKGFNEEKLRARGGLISAAMLVGQLTGGSVPVKVAVALAAKQWGLSDAQLGMGMSRLREASGNRRRKYKERKGPAAR